MVRHVLAKVQKGGGTEIECGFKKERQVEGSEYMESEVNEAEPGRSLVAHSILHHRDWVYRMRTIHEEHSAHLHLLSGA